jgi:hypothetical protein
MAIDIRQEQQQAGRGTSQAPKQPRRGAWTVILAIVAMIAVMGTMAVLALQEDPAPTGGTVISYPEGAATGDREGGTYLVVPEPVAGFTDTSVQVREGTTPVVAGFTDTAVQVREG